jgi:hypothetical protein
MTPNMATPAARRASFDRRIFYADGYFGAGDGLTSEPREATHRARGGAA